MSKYSLREQPKPKFGGGAGDEWASGGRQTRRNNKDERFACIKCHHVFKTLRKLTSHEQSCLKLGEKESFLKYVEPRVVLQDIGQKVALPSSQEENNVRHEPQNQPQQTSPDDETVAANNNIHSQSSTENANEAIGTDEEIDDPNCPVCREEVEYGQPGIACDRCKIWFHRPCLHMNDETYQELSA